VEVAVVVPAPDVGGFLAGALLDWAFVTCNRLRATPHGARVLLGKVLQRRVFLWRVFVPAHDGGGGGGRRKEEGRKFFSFSFSFLGEGRDLIHIYGGNCRWLRTDLVWNFWCGVSMPVAALGSLSLVLMTRAFGEVSL
jgi:hypothetical protein